jgi:hypothetical protein
LRESRSTGGKAQHSFGLERQVEPLVMPSEIAGLEPLRGFLKLGNLVVRLQLQYADLAERVPAFIERPLSGIADRTPSSGAAPPLLSAALAQTRRQPRALPRQHDRSFN